MAKLTLNKCPSCGRWMQKALHCRTLSIQDTKIVPTVFYACMHCERIYLWIMHEQWPGMTVLPNQGSFLHMQRYFTMLRMQNGQSSLIINSLPDRQLVENAFTRM